MEEFYRVRRLPPYVFEQVNRAKAAARNAGADIVDLGMGNPDLPAPAHVIGEARPDHAPRRLRRRCRYETPHRNLSGRQTVTLTARDAFSAPRQAPTSRRAPMPSLSAGNF